MTFILASSDFKKIFKGTKFNLPLRWDGKDFEKSLKELFNEYQKNILNVLFENDSKIAIEIEDALSNFDEDIKQKSDAFRNHLCKDCLKYQVCNGMFIDSNAYQCYLDDMLKKIKHLFNKDDSYREKIEYYCKIKINCHLIIQAVKEYLRGLSADAYYYIHILLNYMIKNPIIDFYKKRTWIGDFDGKNSLKLYRVVSVNEIINHSRKRIFHPPYDMRTKISTNRYSIAGYPSLYLGTSLELCMEEINNNPYDKKYICSRFKVPSDSVNNIIIKVLELGIKPQDFFQEEIDQTSKLAINKIKTKKNERTKRLNWLDNFAGNRYLLWYPIIAACSYIRAFREDPFAPEYIIPQLLMQCLKKYNNEKYNNENRTNEFFGLRYFSCHSEKSSDLGFNYVFPTSGEPHDRDENYCNLLGRSFVLSKPVYFHNFDSFEDCERDLNNNKDLKYFYED